MISYLRRKILVGIADAAKRGNPVARRLVAREMRGVLDDLPVQSPIVSGNFMTPNLSRPLSEDQGNFLVDDHEMMPLERQTVTAMGLLGEKVVLMSTKIGTYGTGGYGFVGLLFENHCWLIIPIFGAAAWIALDGRIVEDPSMEGSTATGPWIVDGDDSALLERLAGSRITGFDLTRHALTLRFDNGAVLEISESPDKRPVFAGNRKKRVFQAGDDLRAALFLSPSGEIFV